MPGLQLRSTLHYSLTACKKKNGDEYSVFSGHNYGRMDTKTRKVQTFFSCLQLHVFCFFLVSLGGVRLIVNSLGTSANVDLLYQPRMVDDDDYGAVGRMRIGRGNRSIRRKPASVPLCPPQIPHDLTWDRTRAAAVGSQRLTAWAMARPQLHGYSELLWNEILSMHIPIYLNLFEPRRSNA
jgi:hypothetical protein